MNVAARIEAGLLGRAARHIFHPVLGKTARAALGVPFAPWAERRLLICHHLNGICWANIYPFFHEALGFADQHGTSIRALPIECLLEGGRQEADVLLVQPWFTVDSQRLGDVLAGYRDSFPKTRIVFIDSFAHTDLRFGAHVGPHIDLYLRKALFCDRREFLTPRVGDTNLTEYYMRLYGLEGGEPVDWGVPPELLDRLGLIQNFLMAPALMPAFLRPEPEFINRPIDLNLRIAAKGTPWYQAMRSHAIDAARKLVGVSITTEERISRNQFLAELRHSKLCWSPFGYGELCWRDIEAFQTGAVLLKPDMSHLETMPDLYRPGETYLPVRWDFSDLEEVVQRALADPDGCRRIAINAFKACRNYILTGSFVSDTIKAIL